MFKSFASPRLRRAAALAVLAALGGCGLLQAPTAQTHTDTDADKRLQAWLPAERDVDAYFLGPKPFMVQLKRELRELGVPVQQTRYEFFGPAAALDG